MAEKTELSVAIEQLRNSAHQILAVADWLEGSGCFAKSLEAPEEIPAVPEPESSGEEPPAEPTLQGFYKYGMIDTPIERRLETSSRTLQQPADARC